MSKLNDSQASLEKYNEEERYEHEKGDIMVEPTVQFTPEETNKLFRRVDWRVMPILSLLYLLSFLDRGNIGNARGYGLEADLGMKGLQYNAALSAYFVTYCSFEVVANIILKLLTPNFWLASITVAWGICCICLGFVNNLTGLVVVRLALGLAEAGLFPGVIYLISSWYPRHRVQQRIAFFFGAATAAGSVSGLLAYAIGHITHKVGPSFVGVGPWRWIFIIEGVITVLAGILAYYAIVNSPADLKALTEDERRWVAWQKYSDAGPVGEAEEVTVAYVISAFTSWQVWVSTAYYMGIVVPLYSIGLSLPTIIKASFGATLSIPNVQLLTVPVYAISVIWVVYGALWSDRIARRYPFVLTNLLLALVGFVIQITNAPPGLKYFGLVVAGCGSYGGLPSVVAWLGGNTMGSTKRSISIATQIGVGNLAGLISSNVYLPKDAPRYITGHAVVIGMIISGLFSSSFYAYMLKKENARRDAEQIYQDSLPENERRVYGVEELRKLGDLAPTFRYTI